MKRAFAIFVSLLVFVAAAYGNDDPNTAKGFVAGQVYQFGDIAHVNLFNGNLNIMLPLGQPYKVNGALSYAFTLSYSGNNWVPFVREDPVQVCDPDGSNCHDQLWASFLPSRRSNAGFGWLASVGGLIATVPDDDPPPAGGTAYRGPDSADHPLSHTNPDAGAGYTSDGVFLRVTNVDGGTTYRDLEFPDGTIKRFQHSDGKLVSIRDRFGNQVTIAYSADATSGAPIWIIQDGVRSHKVIFEKLTGNADPDPAYFYVVKEIDLAAFGGAQNQAVYKFHYNPDSSGTDHPTLISRRLCVCAPNGDTALSRTVLVPMLTELTLPDGTSYHMTYNTGDGQYPKPEIETGNLIGMTLPTLGAYQWDYQEYAFPHGNQVLQPPFGGIINPPENMNIASGLLEQRMLDASGNKLSVTKYGTRLLTTTTLDSAKVLENSVTVMSDPLGTAFASKTLSYFNTDVGSGTYSEGMTPLPQPDPNTPSDVINPRTAGGVQRYLSSKTYDGSNHLARATFVSYDDQYRLGSQEVVTYDPTSSTQRYLNSTRTDYSDFDGYGHYRTVTTSGDFAGNSTPRTVTTAYNRPDTDVGGSIFDTGTYGGVFHPWLETTPWILNMYSSVTASDGSGTQKSLGCFDTATGFLLRTRTMLGTTPQAHDIIARYTSDAGNAGSEEYFGGDDGAAQGDIGAVPTSSLCDATLNTSAYPRKFFISHHYTAGSLDKTSYLDPACSTSCASILDTVDRTIDAGTGLPSASRDPSGLSTGFSYDPSGRITLVAPPGDLAATSYTYTPASGTSVAASVTVQTSLPDGNGLTSAYKYDALGRLILESMVGDGATRYRTTTYDALGRKSSESTLGTNPIPDHFTTYVYDALDRPLSVTEPDGSVTSFNYVAEPSTTSHTVLVSTASGDVAATTKERHDRQNRLAEVVEPNGTITDYTYDVADHLTSVTMGVQYRSFSYDGRGFLNTETHPEIGQSGNGTTTYSQYDARGHARHKQTGPQGGIYDLAFTYDLAERLTDVNEPGHNLKHFVFATSNGTNPADYRNGKLVTAVRSNRMPAVSGDVTISESYGYGDSSGKLTTSDTVVMNGGTVLQSFHQLFHHDGLGAITAPGYPDCTVNCSIPSLTSVTNVYTNGLLTSVPGFASSLTYSANGTLAAVTHANSGGTDTITPDSSGMPRPGSIDYSGLTSCTPPDAPSISGASVACSNSAGSASTQGQGLTYAWTISGSPGAAITSPMTGTSITYNAGSGPTAILSVTASNSCGSTATTNKTITVNSPTATVSLGDTQGTIKAVLTGVPNWTITWSDNQTQFNITASPASRTAAPSGTPYTVVSIVDGNGCSGTSSGSATVVPLAPANVSATTDDSNSRIVHVTWSPSQGATSYRIERATCFSSGCWGTAGTGTTAFDDTVQVPSPSQPVVTYLYQVVALAGSVASTPSALDYATTATTLFAEPIVGGFTTIKGSHVKELRNAIDAVRISAGLLPYAAWTGWPASYVPATGHILASHVGDMRVALDEALWALKQTHLPTTANPSGIVQAVHFNDLRAGVK